MKAKRIKILILFSFSVISFHPQNIDYQIENIVMPESTFNIDIEEPYNVQRLRYINELLYLDIGIVKREIYKEIE